MVRQINDLSRFSIYQKNKRPMKQAWAIDCMFDLKRKILCKALRFHYLMIISTCRGVWTINWKTSIKDTLCQVKLKWVQWLYFKQFIGYCYFFFVFCLIDIYIVPLEKRVPVVFLLDKCMNRTHLSPMMLRIGW